MGTVYLAEDLTLHEQVALKFLRHKTSVDDSSAQRFYNEVRTARKVNHPFFCRVHDISEVDGLPFLSMEYLSGGTLHDLIEKQGALPRVQALKIAKQLCLGLIALHDGKILHRDLKPANIMLTECQDVRITDFGLAALMPEVGQKDCHSILGTPAYMAPEQFQRGEVSARSDIFSLGLVLFEMFTGQRAYQGIQDRGKPSAALSELLKGVDPELASIILQCIANDPKERPAAASAVYVVIAAIAGIDPRDVIEDIERPPRLTTLRTQNEMTRRTSPSVSLSPFISGRNATGDAFIGRNVELHSIFNRLANGESSAIVGGPKSGKSSLLSRLSEKVIQRSYLGSLADQIIVYRLDIDGTPDGFTPEKFWDECLEALQGSFGDDKETLILLQKAKESNYESRRLRHLFYHLREINRHLALLIDDFHLLVNRPEFNREKTFFALLRTVTTQGNFTLIPAGRLSVTELNRKLPNSDAGSPYFNHVIDVFLKPFTEESVAELLALAGDRLSSGDRSFIRCVAGRQPFLLQVLASNLFMEPPDDERRQRAARSSYRQFGEYFEDAWKSLDNRGRSAMILLGLAEIAGQATRKGPIYSDEVAVEKSLGQELRKLDEMGFAERVEENREPYHKHCLIWRDQRWTTGCYAFLWWTWEVVVSNVRSFPAYEEWLAAREYELLIPLDKWKKFHDQIETVAHWEARDLHSMIQDLVDEFSSEDA